MGVIRARGRSASLLEVGTGFHPEMTGRENIYMNGAIMGMTKSEISRKLDEIISFSGCERYLDTPVKRYSSGMTVRLGFAIAAHLEPEILVVDEVLAVGDAEFQKKAIGKMQEVSTQKGRTVLFVSHNMAAVRNLCKNCIVLENGTINYMGDVESAIDHYLDNNSTISHNNIIDNIEWIDSRLKIKHISINNSMESYSVIRSTQKTLNFVVEGETDIDLNIDISFLLKSEADIPMATFDMGHYFGKIMNINKGKFKISKQVKLPKVLSKGGLTLDMAIHHPNVAFYMKAPNCCLLECEGFQTEFGNCLIQKNNGIIGLEEE